jgi:acetyl esterase
MKPPLRLPTGTLDLEEAIAESRTLNDGLERLLASQPSVHTIPATVVRRARREGRGVFPAPVYLPEARDLDVPGRNGPVKLRVLAPRNRVATGVYLHIHGGGWTLGAADLQDRDLAALADATGLVTASVEYRLAPEHPYPAGPDDCEDAAHWLVTAGAAALGTPSRFFIGGESAGAHLSVVTLLRLRDRHGLEAPFHAANLVYGSYDLSMTPSQRLWGDRNLILSGPILRYFGDAFLPGLAPEERRAPDISPLFADLRDMPPALFTVGTLDPLLDDTLFMEARWRAAGGGTTLHVWPESVHGFEVFPTKMAAAAKAAITEYLASA